MSSYIAPLLAGLLATLVMSIFTLIPARLGMERVDIVRAAGAFITKDRETAFGPGMVLHFIAGIVFAYLYYAIFAIIKGIPLNWVSGSFAGLVHGVLVMLFVAIAVLEHHPVKRYQRRGPMTGFLQVIAHGIYGLVVGAVIHVLAPI